MAYNRMRGLLTVWAKTTHSENSLDMGENLIEYCFAWNNPLSKKNITWVIKNRLKKFPVWKEIT